MTKNNNLTVKQKINKLDQLISWFNQGDVEIEQAISKYQQAKQLAEDIKQQLDQAQLEIERLK